MFQFLKNLSIFALFLTIAIVSLVFAQDSTSSTPGIIEIQFFDLLSQIITQVPGLQNFAGWLAGIVYAAILGIVYRTILEILKKIPTKWGKNGPNLVWKFATIFFGPSIMYYNSIANSKDPSELDQIQRKIIESVELHFEKHNVLKK